MIRSQYTSRKKSLAEAMIQMFEGGGSNKPFALAFEPVLSKQNRLRAYVNHLNDNLRKEYMRVSRAEEKRKGILLLYMGRLKPQTSWSLVSTLGSFLFLFFFTLPDGSSPEHRLKGP